MKTTKIRQWMIGKGVTQKQISDATGKSRAAVSLTISGHRKNTEVINFLINLGCPETYFGEARVSNG